MKRILLPTLLFGSVACTPSVSTVALEGKLTLPSFPEISSNGWSLGLSDLKGKRGASLGKINGDHFATKLDRRFPSGLYVLSVRHPNKGTILSTAFTLAERKDLVLTTTSTLTAMGLMFGARLGDETLLNIPQSRLEASLSESLKARFRRTYEDSLTGTASVPADNVQLARDTYWELRTKLERTPD